MIRIPDQVTALLGEDIWHTLRDLWGHPLYGEYERVLEEMQGALLRQLMERPEMRAPRTSDDHLRGGIEMLDALRRLADDVQRRAAAQRAHEAQPAPEPEPRERWEEGT